MSNGNLTFNSSELRSIATEMDASMEELKKNIHRIDEACNKLKGAWTGANSNEYYTKIVEKKDQWILLEDVLDLLPSQLRNVANMLDNAESDMAN